MIDGLVDVTHSDGLDSEEMAREQYAQLSNAALQFLLDALDEVEAICRYGDS